MLIASYPIESSIQFIDIKSISPLISHCVVKVCYVDDEKPNRNGSLISKEVATKMAATLPGSPIVGYYNDSEKDFTDHSMQIVEDEETGEWSITSVTRPYGFVPTDAKVWFQTFLDNGVEHEYLVTEGYLWTGVYPESSRILVNGNNQSMEIDPKDWTEVCNPSTSFFIINDAVIRALCILGENVEPCFEGAQIKSAFSLDNNKELKQSLFSMMKTVEELLKGGNPVNKDEKLEVFQEAPVANSTGEVVGTVEVNPAGQQTIATMVADITTCEEYKNLQADFEEIQKVNEELLAQFEAVKAELEAANATLEELKAYKADIELQKKEAMIEKFSMLSDEEKKDVKDNINNYSLDDIEAKLSVLVVRNHYTTPQIIEETAPVETIPTATFSLDSDENGSGLGVPAWVEALDANNR